MIEQLSISIENNALIVIENTNYLVENILLIIGRWLVFVGPSRLGSFSTNRPIFILI